ncbi:sulfite exporter TauE/SafE family protein [Tepidamorphus sp. 3E244]|uniref:sulfite exporter TauE/SafE family protein n=1 Tax=Tepidamorphus sp. 3E244 TaxID=3385498 RepID=UPI0038FCA7F5
MNTEVLALIFLSIGAGAICKGITGMGLPLIAIPLMANFIDVPQAIAITIVPSIVSNGWQAISYRAERGHVDFLPRMLVASAIGVGIGTLFLKSAPGEVTFRVLGVMMLAFVVLRLLRPQFVLDMDRARTLSAPAFLAAGVLQGAVGVAAPIVVTFLNAIRFDRPLYIFTISTVYCFLATVHMVSYAAAGLITPVNFAESVFALLPVAIFMPVGAWIGRRFDSKMFDRAVLVVILLMAIRFLTVTP